MHVNIFKRNSSILKVSLNIYERELLLNLKKILSKTKVKTTNLLFVYLYFRLLLEEPRQYVVSRGTGKSSLMGFSISGAEGCEMFLLEILKVYRQRHYAK